MKKFSITSRKNPIVGKVNDIRSKPSEEAFLLQGEKFIYDIDPSDIRMLFVTDEEKHSALIGKLSDYKTYLKLRLFFRSFQIREPVCNYNNIRRLFCLFYIHIQYNILLFHL